MQKVLDFIAEHWSDFTRFNPASEGAYIGLPHPYTAPCADASCREFRYWDTYFICRGLALQNRFELVRDNCENFIYEVNEKGLIPGVNRLDHLSRSQPPLFGAILELTGTVAREDRAWLRRAARTLEIELHHWKYRRRDRCGLTHYGTDAADEELEAFYPRCVKELGYPAKPSAAEMREAVREAMAEEESGWAFTPRFGRRCQDYAAIDLNSLLVQSRTELGLLYRDLGDIERSDEWLHSAEIRKELMQCYCWNDRRGVFLDYNFVTKQHSPVFSCASLFPLWCGLATPEQAESTLRLAEQELECEHGLAACAKNDAGCAYRWDYPTAWPPLQLIAIEGFDRYGFLAAARRIAEKYVEGVVRNFEISGGLPEQYDAVTGLASPKDKRLYAWTAGTFVFAAEYLRNH